MFIVLGYNNTFQLHTKDIFPKTHNNMKHSHCSSLLVFVHASNLAGCNSEDILEKAYQKSCYFQSSQDWAWDFKDMTNGTCREVAALCCITLAQVAPTQVQERIGSNRNLMKRPALKNVFSSTFLTHKGSTGTQCSSGFVPFLQVPLGFGQAWEQISPESSIINTVMTEECSMKQSLKGNAAFLLNSEKQIQGSFFTNHKPKGKKQPLRECSCI